MQKGKAVTVIFCLVPAVHSENRELFVTAAQGAHIQFILVLATAALLGSSVFSVRQVDYLVCINPLSRAYASTLWYTQKIEFAIRPIPVSEVCSEKTVGGALA